MYVLNFRDSTNNNSGHYRYRNYTKYILEAIFTGLEFQDYKSENDPIVQVCPHVQLSLGYYYISSIYVQVLCCIPREIIILLTYYH